MVVWEHDLQSPEVIIAVAILGSLLVLLVLNIWRLPQNKKSITFKVLIFIVLTFITLKNIYIRNPSPPTFTQQNLLKNLESFAETKTKKVNFIINRTIVLTIIFVLNYKFWIVVWYIFYEFRSNFEAKLDWLLLEFWFDESPSY